MSSLTYVGQPALSSFIPPSVDSIILDYQSPNAQPGFYPNEDPSDGGIGEAHASVPITDPSYFPAPPKDWLAGCDATCLSQKQRIASRHTQIATFQTLKSQATKGRLLVACRKAAVLT